VSESPEQQAERAERMLRYAERQMAFNRLIAAICADFLATQHEMERREKP
jgi:hypothetical protein